MAKKPSVSARRAQRAPKTLRRDELEDLTPFFRSKFRAMALSGAASPAEALQNVFVALYGKKRSPDERLMFLSVAATLVRRTALEIAPAHERVGDCRVSAAELREWFAELDSVDPITAKIIDLRCFADLKIDEIAEAIDLPDRFVSHTLERAIATLKSRTRAGTA